MEKAVDQPRTSWPTLFDSGWIKKFFNAPLAEFFNLGKVMNIHAVNVSKTDKEFKLFIAAPGLEKKDFKIEFFERDTHYQRRKGKRRKRRVRPFQQERILLQQLEAQLYYATLYRHGKSRSPL